MSKEQNRSEQQVRTYIFVVRGCVTGHAETVRWTWAVLVSA